MPWSFWTSYLLKLGIVGIVLTAIYASAQTLRRLRFFAARNQRRMCVVESAALSQHAAVHLLNVGTRYFLVGTSGGSIAMLAELAPTELVPAEATR